MKYSNLTDKQKVLILDLETASDIGIEIDVVRKCIPEEELRQLILDNLIWLDLDNVLRINKDFKFNGGYL